MYKSAVERGGPRVEAFSVSSVVGVAFVAPFSLFPRLATSWRSAGWQDCWRIVVVGVGATRSTATWIRATRPVL